MVRKIEITARAADGSEVKTQWCVPAARSATFKLHARSSGASDAERACADWPITWLDPEGGAALHNRFLQGFQLHVVAGVLQLFLAEPLALAASSHKVRDPVKSTSGRIVGGIMCKLAADKIFKQAEFKDEAARAEASKRASEYANSGVGDEMFRTHFDLSKWQAALMTDAEIVAKVRASGVEGDVSFPSATTATVVKASSAGRARISAHVGRVTTAAALATADADAAAKAAATAAPDEAAELAANARVLAKRAMVAAACVPAVLSLKRAAEDKHGNLAMALYQSQRETARVIRDTAFAKADATIAAGAFGRLACTVPEHMEDSDGNALRGWQSAGAMWDWLKAGALENSDVAILREKQWQIGRIRKMHNDMHAQYFDYLAAKASIACKFEDLCFWYRLLLRDWYKDLCRPRYAAYRRASDTFFKANSPLDMPAAVPSDAVAPSVPVRDSDEEASAEESGDEAPVPVKAAAAMQTGKHERRPAAPAPPPAVRRKAKEDEESEAKESEAEESEVEESEDEESEVEESEDEESEVEESEDEESDDEDSDGERDAKVAAKRLAKDNAAATKVLDHAVQAEHADAPTMAAKLAMAEAIHALEPDRSVRFLMANLTLAFMRSTLKLARGRSVKTAAAT